MDNDDLEILTSVALDMAQSYTTIQQQLKTLQTQLQGYTIKLTAELDKAASRAKINGDIKSLKPSNIKVAGQLDTATTRKQVKEGLGKLKAQQVKIQGVLDRVATNKNLREQMQQLPKVEATASVKTEGAEQVENLRKQMDAASTSAVGMAAKLTLAHTAIQLLRRSVREAVQTIEELDASATNLAIITGGQSGETYKMLKEYNTAARELGATTIQISDAAASWLRRGKDAAETTALIEQSIMLSKVAMIGSETATKNLTSAMKGYKLAVEDASSVVDKLATLDSKAAVTASDLAVAMSQTASSANIGGVSMDRLLGYLATVQEATQRSAETIGQSFKTIFARMGNVKLGNFFDDEGEDLSDVESSLKHYGIALRNAEGDFRDFGEVLDDVYAKWDKFRAVDQRAIAQAFAGTRQQENFLVLMQNYGKALEYAGISADSAGTALQKFNAYQESIEAKSAEFTSAMESLTMDTIDPELVKDLIEAGTAVVEFTEKIGLLKAALVSLGVGGAMKGVQAMATGIKNVTANVMSMGEAVTTLRRVEDVSKLTGDTITRLGTLTRGLSDDQLRAVLTTRQLSAEQMKAILMASAANDKYGIVLGVFDDEDSWDKNLAKADEFAEAVHNLNADVVELSETIGGLADSPDEAVAALREVNQELEAQSEQYKAIYDQYHDNWALQAWMQNEAQIARNNAAIESYLSLLDDAGSVDISSPWKDVFYWFDGYTSIMQQLAEIQAEVADGFVISAAKAREFAAVYPEILENATVAANGEIQLDADVVNNFLNGKRAELDAQIDSQIAQLEAKKAVLEAQMEFSQAELDLAKSVGEGEADVAKEVAEYRLDTANQLTAALIQAGVDEATAFKLAAAAMAGNAEEFDRIAAEVCTDINGNFNSAAYAAAQTIYQNMNSAKRDVASLATQAHNTAQAIAAMAEGLQSGSDAVVGGSGGGSGGYQATITLGGADFVGTDYSYDAKSISLDDFISDLELDISAYTDAIAQIDGQIATLQALKNIPLEKFQSGNGSNGGGGGSGGGTKEVEEYIATLEDYREALERLAKTRQTVAEIQRKISDSDDLKEQLILERELIDAYEREQAALHNLNNQRDSTITAGAQALRELGFEVSYNADTNELWIANMEHLNELTADSAGEYNTLQEATNALRKETEDLIGSITDLNEANQEASGEWWEIERSAKDANKAIKDLLHEIVEQASEAVDSIQNVYDTLHNAADEYAQMGGYLSVDTYQSILALGEQYLAYLRDESGALVINEEAVRDMIAAKTEQLALESSLSYIEALRIAQEEHDTKTLENLLYATENATDATWGLVYANLQLLDLTDDQYNAALANVNAIRALADATIAGIDKGADEFTSSLQNMKSGLDDLLQYVMDMLKQRVQDQITAIEDMKTAYGEVIDQRKESLRLAKEETSYQKSLASKMKELAKLQAKYDALSLDDSRAAKAERASIAEEMAALQDEINEMQADRMVDTTEDALDEMQKAYESEKDAEIKELEDSISSTEKLYRMAMDYLDTEIKGDYEKLRDQLLQWNYDIGSSFQSGIETAVDNAIAALERFGGSYKDAVSGVDSALQAASSNSGQNLTIGNTRYDNSFTDEEGARAAVNQMKINSRLWHNASDDEKTRLAAENKRIATQDLKKYGVDATIGNDGVWYLPDGRKLYEVYHGGTAGAGGVSTLKQDEVFAKLQKGEMVLNRKEADNLSARIERMELLESAFTEIPDYVGRGAIAEILKVGGGSGTVNNVTNNSSQPIEITIGDTVIQGANGDSVQQHVAVTREMVNQIARILKIGM